MVNLMKVNANDILSRLKKPNDRGVKSIYVSKKLWKEFEKSCSGIPASQVIEELMREFVKSKDSKRG